MDRHQLQAFADPCLTAEETLKRPFGWFRRVAGEEVSFRLTANIGLE